MKALEDLGYFCVDNLPVTLLPQFMELCRDSARRLSRVALVMDVREGAFLEETPQVFARLKGEGYRLEVLFLECADEMLIRRFSETRRQHPLAGDGPALTGIHLERQRLAGLRELADRVIDTSQYNVHQLKRLIFEHYGQGSAPRLTITLISFAFRSGLPPEADLVMDVRFLPNPYFVEELRDATGSDPAVMDYLLKAEQTQGFLTRFLDLLDFLVPLYEQEGKASLTVTFGCTGGQHRSVAVGRIVQRHLEEAGHHVRLVHRDEARA
ncbi:MAG: RNase adapter RapZ [Deltaproteobacteria bacterium]|nr:RNase adapter RapZ [Deltaproteobacteria bacterium]MBI3077287.1 RNase adapter RapZ [Deltaproteobacteria bacterium]